jgi:hypothetical protein
MSLKVHFSQVDFFLEKLRSVNNEECERFHQEISTVHQRYQGTWVEECNDGLLLVPSQRDMRHAVRENGVEMKTAINL